VAKKSQHRNGAHMDDILIRNNVNEFGNPDGEPLLLAHGFGCDQNMWRFMVPLLRDKYRIILFDYVGAGKSRSEDFSVERYSILEGYARDLVEVIQALALENVTVVAHSVSCTIAQIAAVTDPNLIGDIVMVCPSPSFINDLPEYEGGFERSDLEELIQLLESNYIGWANYLAPVVMGLPSGDEMVEELAQSFCSSDPLITSTFAKATFFSDYRNLLPQVKNNVLILQSAKDALANVGVGQYMHARLENSKFDIIEAEGHCLHMTDFWAVSQALESFLPEPAQ